MQNAEQKRAATRKSGKWKAFNQEVLAARSLKDGECRASRIDSASQEEPVNEATMGRAGDGGSAGRGK